MDRDWSNILPDIGYVILGKLPEFVDHVWFGAVCKNWHNISKEYNELTRPFRGTLPMLFVPVTECETQRRFYSMSYNKLYPNVTLSDIPNKRCCGSSYGWLAFMEEDLSVTLINPFKFKGVTIRLPVIKTDNVLYYVDTIYKLIVSPDSTPDNYTVVAIHGGMCQLATIKSGENRWTYIVGKKTITKKLVTLSDIVFYKGMVYALCCTFKVFSVNVDTRPVRIRALKPRDPSSVVEQYIRSYIVESTSGDLYVLRRHRDFLEDGDGLTTRFKVLKLELHKKNGSVVKVTAMEVKTLNGDSVFMSESFSASIKATNFEWCEPNSIYFTDDYGGPDQRESNELEDSGVYKVEEKSITRLNLRDPNHRYRPAAVWVLLPPYM